ncbi:hypothetical protein PoB_001791400 [Plakobranchus ocellatus]|uniref:Uncharacterized protein n=1 Tax=Plakobranchus ocellatus TaxID=259542 RepID=A0AAV3Z7V7_9GAST|nr:hypothetical protein PoB_001791400 [Plakobranchus ocellatus]
MSNKYQQSEMHIMLDPESQDLCIDEFPGQGPRASESIQLGIAERGQEILDTCLDNCSSSRTDILLLRVRVQGELMFMQKS